MWRTVSGQESRLWLISVRMLFKVSAFATVPQSSDSEDRIALRGLSGPCSPRCAGGRGIGSAVWDWNSLLAKSLMYNTQTKQQQEIVKTRAFAAFLKRCALDYSSTRNAFLPGSVLCHGSNWRGLRTCHEHAQLWDTHHYWARISVRPAQLSGRTHAVHATQPWLDHNVALASCGPSVLLVCCCGKRCCSVAVQLWRSYGVAL
jgi:hypothetical protein